MPCDERLVRVCAVSAFYPMEEDMEQPGVRLRTVLLNLGIPHGEFARNAGVSFCDLSRYLHGERRPSSETRKKLAAALRGLITESNVI